MNDIEKQIELIAPIACAIAHRLEKAGAGVVFTHISMVGEHLPGTVRIVYMFEGDYALETYEDIDMMLLAKHPIVDILYSRAMEHMADYIKMRVTHNLQEMIHRVGKMNT